MSGCCRRRDQPTSCQAYKKEYLSKVARDGYVEVPYQTFVHQAETHTSNTQAVHRPGPRARRAPRRFIEHRWLDWVR